MTHVDGQHDVDINVDITKAMGLAKELHVKLLLQVHFFLLQNVLFQWHNISKNI